MLLIKKLGLGSVAAYLAWTGITSIPNLRRNALVAWQNGQPDADADRFEDWQTDLVLSGSGPQHFDPSWYKPFMVDGVCAQIGVRSGQWTKYFASVCKTVHIFDVTEKVDTVAHMMRSLSNSGEYGTVVPHGHTHRTSDSYTYSLKDLLRSSSRPRLDYAFIDGLHTWYHDGFVFYLLDKMLRVGGILEFDGHHWSFAKSPDSRANAFGQWFRQGQDQVAQIDNVLEMLVEASGRYEVVEKRRIYRKIAHIGQCCKPVPESADYKTYTGKPPWFTSNLTAAMEIGIDEGDTTAKLAKDFSEVHIVDFENTVSKVRQKIQSLNRSGKMASVTGHGSSYRVYDSYTYTLARMLRQGKHRSFNYVFIDGAHEWHHDGFAFFLADMMLPVGGIIVFDDYPWTIAGSPSVNPKKHPAVLKRFTMKQIEEAHIKEVCDVLIDEDPRFKVVERGWRPVYHKVAESDGCCRDSPRSD
jgi:hypothetical protein